MAAEVTCPECDGHVHEEWCHHDLDCCGCNCRFPVCMRCWGVGWIPASELRERGEGG